MTARQMRELIERLIEAGQWRQGDLDILIVVDAGYDVPRLAFLLEDLPVQVLGRMRSDRVLRRAVPPREPHTMGRPPRHSGEFVFGDPSTWGAYPMPRPRPRPASTGRPPPRHGIVFTRGGPTAPRGPPSRAPSRSSRAP